MFKYCGHGAGLRRIGAAEHHSLACGLPGDMSPVKLAEFTILPALRTLELHVFIPVWERGSLFIQATPPSRRCP